jgi:hypothetical protein
MYKMSAEDILTVTLTNDIQSFTQPRIFITLLKLCTVASAPVRNMLPCNDVAFWRQVYSHLNQTVFSETVIQNLLSPAPTSEQGGVVYKRRCIELMVFRILDNQVNMPPVDMYIAGPVRIFLARSNGSIQAVVNGLRTWFQLVRERDPDFPPVSAEFAIALVEAAKKKEIHLRGNARSKGLANFPQLKSSLREHEFW